MPRASSLKARARQQQSQLITVDYDPNNKQRRFHQSAAKYRGFIGGFGSGKSTAGAIEAWKMIGLYPGSLGVIGRLEFTALQQSSMKTFFQWGPEAGWEYDSSEHKLYVPVGDGKVTEVLFWHFDNPDPLRSMEIDWWWIDEAHEVPEDTFLMLEGRLRGHVGPQRGWITSNPNGRDWMWKHFVDQSMLDKSVLKDFNGTVARSDDNFKHLPEGYIERLRASYPEEWVKRYLDSSFDTFEGQIYPEFGAAHVIEPYHIPEDWPRYRFMDIGFANPTVVLWCAMDMDGRLVIYNEYYRSGADPTEHWNAIKGFDGGAPWMSILDPAADQSTAGAKISVMRQYLELGMRVKAANNAVWPGIMAVKQRLMPATDGEPRLFVFNTCKRLMAEMQSYCWEKNARPDEQNNKEQPKKKDDHGPDALRYGCMHFPVSEVAQDRFNGYAKESQPPKRRLRSRVGGY